VLSLTPGNFLADHTVKTSEKQVDRTGETLSLRVPSGSPTLMKENLRLWGPVSKRKKKRGKT